MALDNAAQVRTFVANTELLLASQNDAWVELFDR
jgi:hypothetical protein